MNNILTHINSLFNANAWLSQILIALLIGLIFHWFEKTLYHRLLSRLKKTAIDWDKALLKAIHLPFLFLLWSIIATFMLPVLATELKITSIFNHIGAIRELFFVVAIFWFSLRFIGNIEKSATRRIDSNKHLHDRTTIRAVAQLLRVTTIVITILIVMQTLGVKIATLLAVGGVGGIALGFAAKDTLANFLGGMMIFWDRPFCVGDWINSPDREIEGTVEHIGWRLTRIRTFDKRPMYVPNGVFSTITVVNPSRMSNRRIKTVIGLRYDDAEKVALILNDIENMLRKHPEIDQNQTLMVNLFEFGASSLNFFIYTFTKTTDWVKFQAVQQDVFLKAMEIITHHKAECAFPTTTLNAAEGLVIQKTKGAGNHVPTKDENIQSTPSLT